jgi:hypothetical protein
MSGLDFNDALLIAEMAGCRVLDTRGRAPTPNTPILHVFPPGNKNSPYRLIDGTGAGPEWRAMQIAAMVSYWNGAAPNRR